MLLRLHQIYEFARAEIRSRNINEGEELLKSGKVMTVGCSNTSTTINGFAKKITGLVSQTTDVNDIPHTVEGLIAIVNKGLTIQEMKCSCKVGLPATCEHVVAVLLYLERNDIEDLADLSSVDLRSLQSSEENDLPKDFTSDPVHTPCASGDKMDETQKNDVPDLFDRLCSLNPDSVVQSPRVDQETAQCNGTDKHFLSSRINEIISNSLNSDWIIEISNLPSPTLNNCCLSVLSSLSVSDPVKLCYESAKSRECWMKERQLRVSGSRIYPLYTYAKNAKPNWEKKAKNYFWPQEVDNKYVRHGVEHEQLAREAYEKLRKCKVEQCGFVVHPECPWVGYSPDGVVFGKNAPELLLEFKCPYLGKTKTIAKCLDSCSFLDKDYNLKRKHQYYGQVQLGQLILNVQNCHFAVYASFDDSIHIIEVPLDKKFALEMLAIVRNIYMTKMLHYVCTERERNDTSD